MAMQSVVLGDPRSRNISGVTDAEITVRGTGIRETRRRSHP